LGTGVFGDQSAVIIQGGRSYFDFPHLTEFYGGAGISAITYEITPVPEPAAYGLAGMLLIGAFLAVKKFPGRTKAA